MQEILTLFLLAISLSMDTFSLSLCFGTMNISKIKTILLSSTVGIFHFIMPLLGMTIGNTILKNILVDGKYILLLILSVIGIDMIVSAFKDEEKKLLTSFGAIILFALSVSIDSFSTGIGLNLITQNTLLALLSFTFFSASFTLLGILLGKKLSNKYGKGASIIGGIILIVLGLYFFIN